MMERASLAVMLDASRAPDSAIGRALLAAMANAADVTFKDVVREACLSRDHFMAWTDAAGSAEAAAGKYRRRSESRRAFALTRSTVRSSTARICPGRFGSRLPTRSPRAAMPTRRRPRASSRRSRDGYRPGRRISQRVSDRRQDAARFGRDQQFSKEECRSWQPVRRRDRPSSTPDRKAPRSIGARSYRSLAAYRYRGCRELPP